MNTTEITWRAVDPAEAERNGIGCATFGYCSELAAFCRQWKTAAMSAPAFYYYCRQHAEEGAARDGIRLQPSDRQAEGDRQEAKGGADE